VSEIVVERAAAASRDRGPAAEAAGTERAGSSARDGAPRRGMFDGLAACCPGARRAAKEKETGRETPASPLRAEAESDRRERRPPWWG
jgi:hypothetical protein